MPSLGISSGIAATNKFRKLSSVGNNTWSSDTEDWLGVNANVSQSSGQLLVEATASLGYAQKIFNVDAGATYIAKVTRHYIVSANYSTFASFGAFNTATGVALGSTLNVSTDATSLLQFSFLAENTVQVSIRLITVTNSKTTEWDDFSLAEEGVYL